MNYTTHNHFGKTYGMDYTRVAGWIWPDIGPDARGVTCVEFLALPNTEWHEYCYDGQDMEPVGFEFYKDAAAWIMEQWEIADREAEEAYQAHQERYIYP